MKTFKISGKSVQELCRQAPEFTEIVKQEPLQEFQCSGDLFFSLVQNIVSQQLAVKAADAIFRKVQSFLGMISAETLANADPGELRSCGLSGRKIEYLKGIANAVISGKINFDLLAEKNDSEIIAELVQLKGVGTWTAEMLLISALGRPDVLSYKDLGIRRGIMMLYQLDNLPEAEFEKYRKRYSPHGTLASFYLWRIKDGALNSINKQQSAGENV